jgi:hypothetical protein
MTVWSVRHSFPVKVTPVYRPGVSEGFHAFEADNDLRWTDGDAMLPNALLAGFDGPSEVVAHPAGTARYIEDSRRQHVA